MHDPTMHDPCINYANMLNLYRDNSWYHRKWKYKCEMQRSGFLGEESKPDQRSFLFWYFENNIAKLVRDIWGNAFVRLNAHNNQKFWKIHVTIPLTSNC